MKQLITIFSLLFILLIAAQTNAQIKELLVGVNGFTCSLCAKGVEGQFKALDYVSTVETDLKNTTFTIRFKDKMTVNLKEIMEAVTDGGFTVRDIVIEGNGILKNADGGVYSVETGNSTDLKLHGLKTEFEENDKVSFKGKVSEDTKSVNVSEIRKI